MVTYEKTVGGSITPSGSLGLSVIQETKKWGVGALVFYVIIALATPYICNLFPGWIGYIVSYILSLIETLLGFKVVMLIRKITEKNNV